MSAFSVVFNYSNVPSTPWRRYVPLVFLIGVSFLIGVKAGFLNYRSLAVPVSPGSSKEDSDVKYVGIKNLSNTCYMNSVLQSLFFCKPFRESVLGAAFKKKSVGQELKAVFQKLAEGGNASSKVSVKPFGLVAAMDVDVDVQQDAEEFFLSLLNAVEDSLDVDNAKCSKEATDASSPVRHFRFSMRQRIRCMDHAHDNDKELSQLDLSLDISRSHSLPEALARHFEPELLRDENRYRCSQHGLQEAEKSLRLRSLPDCLVVHLQRFSFDAATGQMLKVSSPGPFMEGVSKVCVCHADWQPSGPSPHPGPGRLPGRPCH
ncbi:ubiquitin carboxyl-terminal hydrolase [archaeon]|nr:MAG: ubiquitin carboxyl-terminal hydrolase [archaeon]